jgi:hypothetical protein
MQFCCGEVDCAVHVQCVLCVQVSVPVMVPGELDSLLEGFSITRGKFLSDNAEKVKMLQMFSKFSYPLLTITYKIFVVWL